MRTCKHDYLSTAERYNVIDALGDDKGSYRTLKNQLTDVMNIKDPYRKKINQLKPKRGKNV